MRQRHPVLASQSSWLAAVFVDDASSDGTVEAVRRALAAAGDPARYRLVVHPRNLGLAETLNEVFAQASTPFVLTCHLDCRFGSDDYVASMLELIERDPHAAAITGQPRLPPLALLPFAEKLNVVANLIDVVPASPAAELVPVGFAEGSATCFGSKLCVAWAATTLACVSRARTRFWLRSSGPADTRSQAPRLVYHLSVSAEQDSTRKLLRHQRLFGRTTPYIVLAVPGSLAGLVGRHAGANRSRRTLLRATQLTSSAVYALVAAACLAG